MGLYDKIQQILFEKELSINDFLRTTGFSKGLYYNIKSGDKSELRPDQAKAIQKNWPEYTQEWLMDSVSEDSEEYGMGVYLNKNHERLMESDPTYRMWFEKMATVEAMKMLKDLLSEK